MTPRQQGGSAWRSARFPAVLLILFLAAVAGLVTWLTIASPPAPVLRKAEPPTAGKTVPVVPPPAPAAPVRSHPAPAAPATPPAADRQAAAHPSPPQTAVPSAAPPTSPAMPPAAKAPAGAGPARSAAVPTPPSSASTPAPPAQAPTAPMTAPPPAPRLPRAAIGPPLAAAPDPALIQRTPRGPLPVVGADGREAWRVYARPFDASDRRPRIALVIYGLGISAAATEAAIQGLPGAIALAFSPYADDLDAWISKARAAGHEVLLMAPMEPDNYPAFDPGPQGLLTSLEPVQNVERLEWMLSRAAGAIGVASHLGSRFTASRRHITPVLAELKRRGLMYLDSQGGGVPVEVANRVGVPFAASAFFIDERAAREAIDARLARLERMARRNGHAVAMGYVYPVTLERVAAWAGTVEERGFVLAPVSALASRVEP